jgi:hypothetical protein
VPLQVEIAQEAEVAACDEVGDSAPQVCVLDGGLLHFDLVKPPQESHIRIRRSAAPSLFDEATYSLAPALSGETEYRTRLEAYNAAMLLWEEVRVPIEIRARSGTREWIEAKVDELGGFHQL